MTDSQKEEIIVLRKDGIGYMKIAQKLGISQNTVKSYCRRNGLSKPEDIAMATPVKADAESFCLQCGVPVSQTQGRKQKRFCSDKCRMNWWNHHQEKINRKANYEFTCACCGKKFTAYGNSNRKYCSHECYINDRFGGIRG